MSLTLLALQRYLAESKRTDAPPQAYVAAEAQVLALLDMLRALRVPEWALPPPVPTAGSSGACASGSSWPLPDWVVGPGEEDEVHGAVGSATATAAAAASLANSRRDEEQDDEEDEDDEDEEAALAVLQQRADRGPSRGHVLLLAPSVLAACMGGSASSVVRAAAMELLLAANISGAFEWLRRQVAEQRRALQDAGVEIANLRDETARLSVSSVAGFF